MVVSVSSEVRVVVILNKLVEAGNYVVTFLGLTTKIVFKVNIL